MKYIGVSSPAWTIPNSTKDTDGTNLQKFEKEAPDFLPQSAAETNAAPKWTFSKSEKLPDPKRKTSKSESENARTTASQFKKDTKKRELLNDDPIFYSKVPRFEQNKKKSILGPGSYNGRKVTRSAPKFSFGYKSFSKTEELPPNGVGVVHQKNPGPGDYEPLYSQIMKKRVNTIHTESADKKKQHVIDLNKKLRKVPGPGHYEHLKDPFDLERRDIKSFTSKKGTFGLSIEDRTKNEKFWVPGVGSYNLNDKTIQAWINRIMTRKGLIVKNKRHKGAHDDGDGLGSQKGNPGPGSYNIRPPFKPVKYQKLFFRPDGEKLRNYTFGNSVRQALNYIDFDVPGPDRYFVDSLDFQTKDIRRKAASFDGSVIPDHNDGNTFGKSKRKPLLTTGKFTPGPGAYNPLTKNKSKPPSYSMVYRPKNKMRTGFPGPGTYEIDKNYKIGSQSVKKVKGTFSRADRFGNRGVKLRRGRNRTPSTDSKKQFFGSRRGTGRDSRRNKSMSIQESGAYTGGGGGSENKNGGASKSFSVGGLRGVRPGPGDYNIGHGGVGRPIGKMMLPAFLRDLKEKKYKYQRQTDLLSYKIKGAGFSKGKRKGIITVDPDIDVGPASYEIKQTVPQLQPWEAEAMKEAGFKVNLS